VSVRSVVGGRWGWFVVVVVVVFVERVATWKVAQN